MIGIKHIGRMNVDTCGGDIFEAGNCILNGIYAFEIVFNVNEIGL